MLLNGNAQWTNAQRDALPECIQYAAVMVRWLLECGADLKIRTDTGEKDVDAIWTEAVDKCVITKRFPHVD